MQLIIIEIDDCGANSCNLNATCIDKFNGFECICKSGFEGNGTYCTGMIYIRSFLISFCVTIIIDIDDCGGQLQYKCYMHRQVEWFWMCL